MASYEVKTPGEGYAIAHGDKAPTNPETIAALESVMAAAFEMFTEKADEDQAP